MRSLRKPLFLLVALVLIPPQLATGGARLVMQVSPPVCPEPAHVNVRVIVEADANNRSLEVTVESADFSRSSEISLDGERAPRTNTFAFRSLPTGDYTVTSTLLGQDGTRTTAVRPLLVVPSPGGDRGR